MLKQEDRELKHFLDEERIDRTEEEVLRLEVRFEPDQGTGELVSIFFIFQAFPALQDVAKPLDHLIHELLALISTKDRVADRCKVANGLKSLSHQSHPCIERGGRRARTKGDNSLSNLL